VVATVNRGALTPDKAREIYGVSIRFDESTAEYRLVG
jgi:catalase